LGGGYWFLDALVFLYFFSFCFLFVGVVFWGGLFGWWLGMGLFVFFVGIFGWVLKGVCGLVFLEGRCFCCWFEFFFFCIFWRGDVWLLGVCCVGVGGLSCFGLIYVVGWLGEVFDDLFEVIFVWRVSFSHGGTTPNDRSELGQSELIMPDQGRNVVNRVPTNTTTDQARKQGRRGRPKVDTARRETSRKCGVDPDISAQTKKKTKTFQHPSSPVTHFEGGGRAPGRKLSS